MNDDEYDIAVNRLGRILSSKGYHVRKSDILWILNQMTEQLDWQDEENGLLERKIFCEVTKTAKEVRVITELLDVFKDSIEINFYGNDLLIEAHSLKRSYHEVIHLPPGLITQF